MKQKKTKIFFINFFLFLILYIIFDILFSIFFLKYDVSYKCYDYNHDGTFYKLQKNCFAKMRLLENLSTFDVYTNELGNRYSGKKKIEKEKKNIIFAGDSFMFGVGVEWENTITGILENALFDYNVFNLGVPSYSPTVYKYLIENLIKEKKIEKVFILLDITDIGDESGRWIQKNGIPYLVQDKIFLKQSFFEKTKRKYFKGTFIIINTINDFFRDMRKKIIPKKNVYIPSIHGNNSGSFLYKDHHLINWDVEKGINKTKIIMKEIGEILKKEEIELNIIILPWPDTMVFGQKIFNFENFGQIVCELSKCKNLVNLFPEFQNIKNLNESWLEDLYLENDIHLNKNGNYLVAKNIISTVFNRKIE